MGDPDGTIGVGGRNFEKGVAAGLDKCESRLILIIVHVQHFPEAHLLGIESQRLIEIIDAHGNVIHAGSSREPISLGQNGAYSGSEEKPNQKDDGGAHYRTPFAGASFAPGIHSSLITNPTYLLSAQQHVKLRFRGSR